MRKAIGSLLLALSSVGLVLFLAEAGLRFLDRFPPPLQPIVTLRPDLYQADDQIGYRLWPNMQISYRYPSDRPYLIPIVSNSSGFRNNREFDEPNDRLRILVVGDSFVFGQGVRAEERLTEVMESNRPVWRVDNMGMTGFGLDLVLRSLERHAPAARPDVVVLCVYTDQFRRLLPYYAGIGFEYHKFELEHGSLVSVPHRYPGRMERTHLVQAWLRVYWQSRRNRYDLNEAILDRFLENSERHGFKLVTVFLPGKGDTSEDQERRSFLRDWAERNDVSHLDLTEPIHSAGVANVYLEGDWHWNAEGHRVAAEQIANFLSSELPSKR